jgi:1-acyl-sn-glycerol-3-phosphate acyltransferase
MKALRTIYTTYCVFIFAMLFFIFFIPLMIPIVFPKQFRLVGIINRWWARGTFFFAGIPWSVEYKSKLDPRKQYIFCANHFSYLDIPAMGLNHHNTIFVGKSAMEQIPLFGFMYRKLHITVNREKLKSRYTTVLRTLHALDEGKSLVIFPEGGMITTNPPHMTTFKDGAFRASIEKQVPIVPVTIPYNWLILPDEPKPSLRWGKIKLIFHEPVSPEGLTLREIDLLKERVGSVISQELKKHFP